MVTIKVETNFASLHVIGVMDIYLFQLEKIYLNFYIVSSRYLYNLQVLSFQIILQPDAPVVRCTSIHLQL